LSECHGPLNTCAHPWPLSGYWKQSVTQCPVLETPWMVDGAAGQVGSPALTRPTRVQALERIIALPNQSV
jgi:hypothetical protein